MTDIKLIVTDMDGTFLNSNYEVSPDFTEIYTELKRRNILFVPASGRQMPGITKYFEEIENKYAQNKGALNPEDYFVLHWGYNSGAKTKKTNPSARALFIVRKLPISAN